MAKTKSKSKLKGWDENLTLAEHDKIFNINEETRKELNNPKGWITNTDKPVFPRVKADSKNKKTTSTKKVKKVDTVKENVAGTQEITTSGGEIVNE